MNYKRVVLVKILVTVIFCLLIVRVFFIQIVSGSKLTRAAAAQRVIQTELPRARGNILDKYGIPLTNRSRAYNAVIFPPSLKGKADEQEQICALLDLDRSYIENIINTRQDPLIISTNEETQKELSKLGIDGVTTIEYLNRYDSQSIARHVLGYVKKSGQTGEVGLESAFEDVLSVPTENSIGIVTDARLNLVNGLGYRMLGKESSTDLMSLKTTLDFQIQRIVETVLEENHITGAVVVEDVINGDLVAVASKPDFDQNDVAKFLGNSNNALFNRAVAPYSLGSIYKIIDVAAFLEKGGNPSTSFYCPGYFRLGDTEFRCTSYATGGHGYLDLKNAFSASCNTYFINLGLTLGTNSMLDMAKRLGLGKSAGINEQGIPESNGLLPNFTKNLIDGNAANVSIGQGDVMATPVQVANLVAIVANGGIKNRVNIVDGIYDDNMKLKKSLKINEAKRVLDPAICNQLKEMMELVTATGTGTRANISQYGGAAGKTGSAEAGQYVGDRKVVHAWFAGYFPLNTPKYAISVFIEGGESGGRAAAPIFGEIAQQIMKRGL